MSESNDRLRRLIREMNLAYSEACKAAKAIAAELLATDFDVHQCVQLKHSDGSYFLWNAAFVRDLTDSNYVAVFTEHFGHFVFDKDDVESFGEITDKVAADLVRRLSGEKKSK